jgi:hypothetical protein
MNTTQRRNNVLPKKKVDLISKLVTLVQEVTEDIDLQHFLISLYDETANDKYTGELFGGKSVDIAKKIIARHAQMYSKPYSQNASKGFFRGPTDGPSMEFKFKTEGDLLNFAFLMYLDMKHDETISASVVDSNGKKVLKPVSFEEFCGEKIVVKTKNNNKSYESPVYMLFGRALVTKNKPLVKTPFIKKIEAVIEGAGGKAETGVKQNFMNIYGSSLLTKEVDADKSRVGSNFLPDGHNGFISVDQEDKTATITRFIDKTKYERESNKARVAVLYPIVSVANLMDPGKRMLIESAKEDTKYSMLAQGFGNINPSNKNINTDAIISRLAWNYKKPSFILRQPDGTGTALGAYYTNRAITGSNGAKGKGYAYIVKRGKAKINKENERTNPNNAVTTYRLDSNMSKEKAKSGTTGDRLAKFFGDFYQALTVISYIKYNENEKYHFALGTGDAMLANIFMFMSSIGDSSPNLLFAMSAQEKLKIYGKITNSIRVKNLAVRAVTRMTEASPSPNRPQNRPQNRSQNSRLNSILEGSGNSANTATSRNSTASSGKKNGKNGVAAPKATPIQVINATISQLGKRKRANNNNGPPPVRGPNTQSGVGSKNSMAGNRNKNLNNNASFSGNSQPNANKPNANKPNANKPNANKPNANKARITERNNQRGVKRARNNNLNNVSQPIAKKARIVSQSTAKRVNVSRNKLIQNLRKKNLRNFVVNGLMKSYDNKTKTANQIIREANNFGKTIAAGITAQRMGTLRKRP